MTNEQILKKAIEKAVENRWEHNYKFSDKSWHYLLYDKGFYKLIFSHSFAKAFWGEEAREYACIDMPEHECNCMRTIPSWQWYLQQMVIEEQPLKYIEKFLNAKTR